MTNIVTGSTTNRDSQKREDIVGHLKRGAKIDRVRHTNTITKYRNSTTGLILLTTESERLVVKMRNKPEETF